VPPDVGRHRQVVDDVPERGGLDEEDVGHRRVARPRGGQSVGRLESGR
jgi:hypothetical protein